MVGPVKLLTNFAGKTIRLHDFNEKKEESYILLSAGSRLGVPMNAEYL